MVLYSMISAIEPGLAKASARDSFLGYLYGFPFSELAQELCNLSQVLLHTSLPCYIGYLHLVYYHLRNTFQFYVLNPESPV